METTEEQIKLANAKKRVAQLKGFYVHTFVYVLINSFLFLIQTNFLQDFQLNNRYSYWNYLSTPIFWGIGLFFHGLFVFLPRLPFVKRWEERKMDEFLNGKQ